MKSRLGLQLEQSGQGTEHALMVAEQEAPYAAELEFPSQAMVEQARSCSTERLAVVAGHNPGRVAIMRCHRCQDQIGRTHIHVWAATGDAHYQAAAGAAVHDQEVDHADVASHKARAAGAASAVAAQLADAGAAVVEAHQRGHGWVGDPYGLPKEPVADQDIRPYEAAVGRKLLQVDCLSGLGLSTVQGRAPKAYVDSQMVVAQVDENAAGQRRRAKFE